MAEVKEIHLVEAVGKHSRILEVHLDNGTVIQVDSCYEGYIQSGGNIPEFAVSQPVAQKYNGWLHGTKAPKPFHGIPLFVYPTRLAHHQRRLQTAGPNSNRTELRAVGFGLVDALTDSEVVEKLLEYYKAQEHVR